MGPDPVRRERAHSMKVLVLGKATERSESGELGSPEAFAAMDRYFQQLNEAGIVLAADGLHTSSRPGHPVARGD